MYPKKGAVLVGADADLVVWDPKRSKTISAKTQQSSIDYNVFEGKEVTGLPRFTLTRGYVAIEEDQVKTREGHGQFVKREPFTAVNKALSTWKELVAPRKVERTGIPATGVLRRPMLVMRALQTLTGGKAGSASSHLPSDGRSAQRAGWGDLIKMLALPGRTERGISTKKPGRMEQSKHHPPDAIASTSPSRGGGSLAATVLLNPQPVRTQDRCITRSPHQEPQTFANPSSSGISTTLSCSLGSVRAMIAVAGSLELLAGRCGTPAGM